MSIDWQLSELAAAAGPQCLAGIRFIYDVHNGVLDCKERWGELFADFPPQVPADGRTPLFASFAAPAFAEGLSRLTRAAREDRAGMYDMELLMRMHGNLHWCRLSLMVSGTGQQYASGMLQDISGRKQREQQLYHFAERDSLTGLYNRRAALARIQLLAEKLQDSRQSHALLMIDLDCFKQINDTFGHAQGDRLLRQVRGVLQENAAEKDIVARIGGDEFLVLYQDLMDPKEAARRARDICGSIAALEPWRGAGQPVSASVGIDFYRPAEEVFEDSFNRADRALYQAKRGGKGAFRIFRQEPLTGKRA